jgi:putative ABC transport system ATP-binding protein
MADLAGTVAAPAATAKLIEARDLFLSFGETPALRGAALGVRPGEVVAVMGPSGSGSSSSPVSWSPS